MHGYEMIQELDDRTGGIWRPSPGSVYPTLQLLEDEGLITSETSDGRKRFTLTDAGREEAAKATETPPWAQYADDDTMSTLSEFRKASFGVMNALSQVGFSGTDEQRARALEVLAETRRSSTPSSPRRTPSRCERSPRAITTSCAMPSTAAPRRARDSVASRHPDRPADER